MNTKIKIKFALSALLLTTLFFSCKKEEQTTVPEPYTINFIPAKTSSELAALRKDPNANLIRTLKEFDVIVAAYVTPLSKLAIIAKLSVEEDEIDGDDSGVPNSDHEGYACSEYVSHTCVKFADHICLAGC